MGGQELKRQKRRFPARADTHLTVEPAHNNWMSFGPAVDKYSDNEFVDAYPYGVRLQIESNGHYGAFDWPKLVGQLTTVCYGCKIQCVISIRNRCMGNTAYVGGSIWFC